MYRHDCRIRFNKFDSMISIEMKSIHKHVLCFRNCTEDNVECSTFTHEFSNCITLGDNNQSSATNEWNFSEVNCLLVNLNWLSIKWRVCIMSIKVKIEGQFVYFDQHVTAFANQKKNWRFCLHRGNPFHRFEE